MGGQNEYFGYLHMGWGIGCIDSYVGNVIASQGSDSLIEFGSTVGVALEADVAEVGLHQARLQVGDTYGGIGHVDAESVREGLHGSLRGAIDIAPGISSIASHTTYINNVSAVALNHAGHDETRHRQQPHDVRVDHRFPVVEVAFIFGFESKGKTGIVDEYVDLLPVCGQALDGLLSRLAVSDVEDECQYLRACGF